ncbi:MAG: tetraacyldisaccharide 4'-kinase [Hyphomicrobium sp.]|nr:MAG: tetraacyldisaccharide 4'-kinase [Hyphomicrobium sp.]
MHREPAWWYAPAGDRRARLLSPLAAIYGWVAERRYRGTDSYRSRLPVICVGNFTAGGTGKTPLALLIATEARARGATAVFLTRGYGGRAHGPLLVEPNTRHTAADVGDEPLLLARSAPTIVARDRAAGVRFIEQYCGGAELIIMDDGLQNAALAKDLTIAVVDGARGVGNGEVIPAGPLRASLSFQLDLADAIVVNGAEAGAQLATMATPHPSSSVLTSLRQQFQGPVLAAQVRPVGGLGWLAERSIVAFAGIGNPQRFFDTLRDAGHPAVAEQSFPDHHAFTATDAERLLSLATLHKAQLVTTEKDLARLSGASGPIGAPGSNAPLTRLASTSRALPIRLAFDNRDLGRLHALIDSVLVKRSSKRLGDGT